MTPPITQSVESVQQKLESAFAAELKRELGPETAQEIAARRAARAAWERELGPETAQEIALRRAARAAIEQWEKVLRDLANY